MTVSHGAKCLLLRDLLVLFKLQGPLLQIRPVFAADYKHDDAPPSCLERTREVLLSGIIKRAKDPQNKDFI
jgi:hypothetical protein